MSCRTLFLKVPALYTLNCLANISRLVRSRHSWNAMAGEIPGSFASVFALYAVQLFRFQDRFKWLSSPAIFVPGPCIVTTACRVDVFIEHISPVRRTHYKDRGGLVVPRVPTGDDKSSQDKGEQTPQRSHANFPLTTPEGGKNSYAKRTKIYPQTKTDDTQIVWDRKAGETAQELRALVALLEDSGFKF